MSSLPRPIAFLTLLAVISVTACKPTQVADPRGTPRLVQVALVEQATEVNRAYTGVVAARIQSNLGFRVQGKVIERLVDTGQIVKRGERLMRIDPTDYSHAIAVQSGVVASARARWVQTDADEQRYRGLVESGAISQLTYDQAKAAADSARALLSAAEAQEKVARDQGDYSTLLADADGTVVETLAEPGQVVAAGQPVLRLAHAGPREASVNLPETERPTLGSRAQARLYGGNTAITARLRQLSDAADPKTRTYEARYVLEGSGAGAPLGATVVVYLGAEQQNSAVQVPLGAIDDEGHGPGIWIVDTAHAQVTYRPVRVREFAPDSAILSDGARAGETVVAVGGHFLHEAEQVQLAGPKVAMQ